MGGIWYSAKRDRRALFLVPLLYWGPLRKAFPVGGFFELRQSIDSVGLVVAHISFLD